MHRLKKRAYEILWTASSGDRPSFLFDQAICLLIILNILAVILETIAPLREAYHAFFFWFEAFSVCVFTTEYVLRLWACTENPRYNRPLLGRIRYALTPLAIIDLLAILPFYLPMLVGMDLRHVRMFRLFRLFRAFKLARYTRAAQLIREVLYRKREELLVTMFALLLLLVFSASFMYVAEHNAQPEVFSSIPASFWWGIVTLTTVGYGDAYPITPLGRLFAGIIAILGVGLVALPAGIISSGFMEGLQHSAAEEAVTAFPRKCPHCGKEIEDR